MDQYQFIAEYIDENIPKFNPELFKRDEYDIIEELKKVILSCQRRYPFIIHVKGFAVITDYKEISDLMYEYEDKHRRNKSTKANDDNIYDYIHVNSSKVIALLVRYYVSTRNMHPDSYEKPRVDRKGKPIKEEDEFTTVILVPKYVNKYYFYLNGTMYLPINQIVDASTYNNTTSNKKKKRDQRVTLKTEFMPEPIYRYKKELSTTEGEKISIAYFSSNAFNKLVLVYKYLFAKFGFYQTLDFLKITGMVLLSETDDFDHEQYYVFTKKKVFYVAVPKMIYDRYDFIQSVAYTVLECTSKNTLSDALNREFWLTSLGKDFGSATPEKGSSVLISLENIYGITIREDLHLPPELKQSIYHILAWMTGEFNRLTLKNNLDISTKKVRIAPYIAFMYAVALSTKIHRISDRGKKITVNAIKRFLNTSPMDLINRIAKCRLVNNNDAVSDNDAVMALKFSYKGVSGMGKNKETVPDAYRQCYPSHLGRVSLSTSSNGDPGMSGIICPLTKLYNGYFSEFEEPHFWLDELDEQITAYKNLTGQRENIKFKEELGIEIESTEKELLDASINLCENLFVPYETLVKDISSRRKRDKNVFKEPSPIEYYEQEREMKFLDVKYEL